MEPPVVIVSAKGEQILLPANCVGYSRLISDIVAENKGQPVVTHVESKHLNDVIQFIRLYASEIPDTEASAAAVMEKIAQAKKEVADAAALRVIMVQRQVSAGALKVWIDLFEIARETSELRTAAYDALDSAGVARFFQLASGVKSSALRVALSDAFSLPVPSGFRQGLVDALTPLARDSTINANNAKNAYYIAYDEEKALEVEWRRRDMVLIQAANALRAAEAEYASIEETLRILRIDMSLRPTPPVRAIVESKNLSGVLRLAQTADILVIDKLLDLCSVAVASFCAGGDDILSALGLAKRKRDEARTIVAKWDVRKRFIPPSVASAIRAVRDAKNIPEDIRAGLDAVDQHLTCVMEPRRMGIRDQETRGLLVIADGNSIVSVRANPYTIFEADIDVSDVTDIVALGGGRILVLDGTVGMCAMDVHGSVDDRDATARNAACALLLPNGSVAVGTVDGDVQLRDSSCIKNVLHSAEKIHGRGSVCMALSSEMLATGGSDGVVRLWQCSETSFCMNRFLRHTGPLRSLAALPDGALFGAARLRGGIISIRTWTSNGTSHSAEIIDRTTERIAKLLTAGSVIISPAVGMNEVFIDRIEPSGSTLIHNRTTLESEQLDFSKNAGLLSAALTADGNTLVAIPIGRKARPACDGRAPRMTAPTNKYNERIRVYTLGPNGQPVADAPEMTVYTEAGNKLNEFRKIAFM